MSYEFFSLPIFQNSYFIFQNSYFIKVDFWQFIHSHLSKSQPVMLLYVLQSEGSSPGRRGFNMAVAADDTFIGTIGGGIMEYKLVEKAKVMLADGTIETSVMLQYHDKKSSHQSGMICSGSQLNAFIPLFNHHISVVEDILNSQRNGSKLVIQLSPHGISLLTESITQTLPFLRYESTKDWLYQESVYNRPIIHIIGGGHVGLALSELMHFLGFYVIVYDERNDLTTMSENTFANEKRIINYSTIGELFNNHHQDYVAIMTVGYRTDKIVLKQLISKEFFYIGLMGSQNKIKTLLAELEIEGQQTNEFKRLFTPIGINIFSKTTREIAVSIAAEIIREKNKDLPTGRV